MILAPYSIAILTIGAKDAFVASAVDLARRIAQGGLRDDTLIDSRYDEERAFWLLHKTPPHQSNLGLTEKLAEARVMGIPFAIAVGARHDIQQLEVYTRKDNAQQVMSLAAVLERTRASPYNLHDILP
jgi:prolyl-tRNA synthetase